MAWRAVHGGGWHEHHPSTLASGRGEVLADATQALFRALQGGDVRGAEAALACGARVDATSGDGKTALVAGVEAGSPVCVALLLQAGANAQEMPADGWSPLAVAARFSGESETQVQCAWLLLDAGADPWAVVAGDAGGDGTQPHAEPAAEVAVVCGSPAMLYLGHFAGGLPPRSPCRARLCGMFGSKLG